MHNFNSVVNENNKPDFIVTPNGTVLPTKGDLNLVYTQTPTNRGGDWFQIYNDHTHDGLSPHTHYSEVHTENGRIIRERRYRGTTAEDIDNADKLIREGKLRQRKNKKD